MLCDPRDEAPPVSATVRDVLAGGAVTPEQSPSNVGDFLIDVVVIEILSPPNGLLQFLAAHQCAWMGDKEEKQIEGRWTEFYLPPVVQENPVGDVQRECPEAVQMLWFVQHKTLRKESEKSHLQERVFHRSLLGKAPPS
jgi:hypothetical protein